MALDPSTGQLVSTFKNTPPQPFEKLTLHLFGGPRASQSTPPSCGAYSTSAQFTPWSTGAPTARTSDPAAFHIDQGAEGSPCPGSQLPFAPSLSARPDNLQAGAFSPLTITINHPDSDQAMLGVTTHLPTGMAALISSRHALRRAIGWAGMELWPRA